MWPFFPASSYISVWRLWKIKDKSQAMHLPKITDIKCLISVLLWHCHRFPGMARRSLFSLFFSPLNLCRRNRELSLLSEANWALKSHLVLRRALKDRSTAVRFVLPEPQLIAYGDSFLYLAEEPVLEADIPSLTCISAALALNFKGLVSLSLEIFYDDTKLKKRYTE